MKRPDPPSDRDIAEAFLALDGTIPDGHLDDFSSRVLARLDEPEAGDMDSRELARGSGLSRTDEAALGAAATSATPEPVRDENSGLHEIKALASTTRRRISQKATSESEASESLLVGASSGSFRAATLPGAHSTSTTSGEVTDDRASTRARDRLSSARPVARPAAEVDTGSLPSRGSSAPFWLLGGVATAAAAAAVAVFVFGVGREKKDQDQTQAAASGETVARAESPTPAAQPAATGSASADGQRFAEPPPPAEAAPGAAPTATSSPAMVARGDDPQASDEGDIGGGPQGRAGAELNKDAKATDKGAPARAKKDGKEKEKREVQSKSDSAKGAGGKDLNDVLDEVTGGVKTPAPVKEEAVKKPSKKGLDRGDVSKAMSAVRSQVMRCRDKEQFEGTVTVKFHVAPSGAVTSAEATGSKAGTPTGNCVAAAVKRASFPAFDGSTTSFTYPFLLAE